MWQRWPPQSWHGMTIYEAMRVSAAFAEHMKTIEPLIKAGRLF